MRNCAWGQLISGKNTCLIGRPFVKDFVYAHTYPPMYIFLVNWPNNLGLIDGYCTVCEQPWMDLIWWPLALKATTLTTVPQRPFKFKWLCFCVYFYVYIFMCLDLCICFMCIFLFVFLCICLCKYNNMFMCTCLGVSTSVYKKVSMFLRV